MKLSILQENPLFSVDLLDDVVTVLFCYLGPFFRVETTGRVVRKSPAVSSALSVPREGNQLQELKCSALPIFIRGEGKESEPAKVFFLQVSHWPAMH